MKTSANILVVDDDETSRQLLKHFINKIGHTAILAIDGNAALDIINKQTPDLILLDILMPVKDGYELLKTIRSDIRLRHIPIVMITAVDEFKSVIKCIKDGADDYLPKPINITLLEARISSCLEKKSWHDYEQRLYAELIKKYNDLKEYEKESKYLLDAIDQSSASILITDSKGKIEYINKQIFKTTGYSKDEILGKKPSIFKSGVHQDDFYVALWKTINAGNDWHERFCNKRKNGELYWEYQYISPVKDGDGNISYFVAVKIDDTERIQIEKEAKNSKDEFNRLLTITEDAIISVDIEHNIIVFNKSAERIFGYVAADVVGKHINILLPVRFRANHDKHIVNFAKSGISSKRLNERDYKLFGLRENGEEFPTEISISQYMAEGKLIFTAVVRDITKQIKMEDEVIMAEKIKSIGDLAGGIVHNFNNVLTSILINTDLAILFSKNGNINNAIETLKEIEKTTIMSSNLTKQFQIFAKGGELIKEPISITSLIRDVVEFATKGPGVKREFNIDKKLWPAEVYKGQIDQVINNLVINAVQSMPKGGKIIVSAQNIDKIEDELTSSLSQGKYIKISINDQGTGIKKEDLAKIFFPSFTTKPKGNGLGLASSYTIIKNHSGLITVFSELGVGTTFHIYLPALSDFCVEND